MSSAVGRIRLRVLPSKWSERLLKVAALGVRDEIIFPGARRDELSIFHVVRQLRLIPGKSSTPGEQLLSRFFLDISTGRRSI
jgi:hypothetical protein